MADTLTSDADRLKFRAIFTMIGRFRDLDPDAPVQQSLIFC